MKSLIFIFTVAIMVQSVFIAGAPADDKVHPELSRQMALSLSNNSQDTIRVIVIMKEQYHPPEVKAKSIEDKKQQRQETTKALKEQSQQNQQSINAALKGKEPEKVKNIEPLWIMNAIGLEATPDVIEELARRDDVAQVIPDFEMHVLEDVEVTGEVGVHATTTTWGVEMINAPQVWALGYNGTGVNVSIVDTGVNYSHPDLADNYLIGYDFVNSDNNPMDDHGHGTHVAGTVAGTGTSGTQTGVAPGANLFGVKALDAYGSGYYSDIILGVQWSINNGADIVSLSLGGPHDTSMTTMVNNAIAAGVVPVIAAGNNETPDFLKIDCPGDEEKATTVGAIDSTNTIASFSSRGPVTWINGTYIKPDVVAPGVGIVSTSINGVSYYTSSGTSMATPHVSGAAALILQANPGMTPLQVGQLLEDTAIDLGTAGKDNIYGSGRIDVLKAISIQAPNVSNISINPDPANIDPVLNATISDLFNNISYADFYIDYDSANSTIFSASDGAFNSNSENVTTIINISDLNDGNHVVTIRTNDSLDNWNNNTNTSFVVDTTFPIITLISPVNNSYIQNGTIIQFNITDLTLANITYSINSSQAIYTNITNETFNAPYKINTTGWNDSIYHIRIWANDTPGHESISNYQFIIDETQPNIFSVLHNGTGIMDEDQVLWVNLTGDSGNQSYFKIAGTDINVSLVKINSDYYSLNYSIPAGIEVNNSNLTGYLIDKAGNLNSSNASTSISIDSLSPRINLTSLSSISYIKSGTIINFTISDTFLANVTYSLNSTQANYTNKTNIVLPPPYEINTTDWNESSFDLKIWANDTLNHINTSNYHIIVDNAIPNLTLTTPISDYSTYDTSVTIKGTTDEDAEITINGVFVSNNSSTFSKFYSLNVGYNNFTINATDKVGNVNSTGLIIRRYTLVTPSSNNGGGGGGGTSGEDFNNIAETQTQRNSIFKNDDISYAFEQTLNPIIYVNFTSKISAGTIASKIEVLRNTSTLANMSAPGLVYKNINIWVGNYGWASDRSIVDASIFFAVPRDWIKTQNIQEDSITLYRYNNDSWEQLTTSMLNNNEQYLYYQSLTPGFSPFAISGDRVLVPAPTVIQAPVPKPAENTSIALNDEIPVEPKPDGWNAPLWALLTVLVLSLIATIYANQDGIYKVIDNIKQQGRR